MTLVDSLTSVFSLGMQTHRASKNGLKNYLRRNGNPIQIVDSQRGLGIASFLADFAALCAIIALAIIAELFG